MPPELDARELDDFYMGHAVDLAEDVAAKGDRPFGCVIVDPTMETLVDYNRIVAWGAGTETPMDPTRHSEIQAIRRACQEKGGLLQGCWLYSTHEPCAMCCGAINHAKLSRVIWGSDRADLPELFRRRNTGAVPLLFDTSHPPTTVSGVLKAECCKLFDKEIHQFERLCHPGGLR